MCRDEETQDCDYRRSLLAHGSCYATLKTVSEQVAHEKLVEILRTDAIGF